MDFRKFIEQGVSAEYQARLNRSEIHSVIRDFRNAVEEYSDGKLTIVLQRLFRNGNILQSMAKLMNPETYHALVFSGTKVTSINKELCEIKESDDGYPITVKYNSESNTYYDKDSFSQALGNIAASANFGKVVLKLIDQIKKSEEKLADEAAEAAVIENASIEESRAMTNEPTNQSDLQTDGNNVESSNEESSEKGPYLQG